MFSSALLRDRKTVLLRRGVPIALGGVIITGAGVAYADHGDSGPVYRTTSVSLGEVDQVITLTGTVAKLTQQDASFGVSGTVKKVAVATGDKVAKGQVLATLDTADLEAAVTAAKATLARANAQLETDEASSSSSTSSTSSSDAASVASKSSPTVATAKPSSAPAGGTTAGGVDLAAPTNAVVAALATATADLQQASDASTARDTACAAVLTSTTDNAADTATDSPTAEPTAAATETAATTPSTADLQSCVDAQQNVSDLQNRVATDQAAVQTTQNALSAAMDRALAALTAQASAAASPATGGAATSTGAPTSGSTGGSGQTNAVDKAAKVAVDSAAILSAQAALDSAKEDLDEAVLTAPIDGVVGAVGITKGATASTSNAITILGDGAVKVTLDVSSATAQKLTKGMSAKVTADGASAPSDGVVESIGIVPSSSGGSSTYPVVVLVANPADGLAEGAAAGVAITLKAVDNAVTVPNSAVTAVGTGATGYVTLLQNGKAVRQTVTTGAVGTTATQIVSGVAAGQTLVLADTAADVPASSTTANTATFGGGTFPAGGPGGGTARRD